MPQTLQVIRARFSIRASGESGFDVEPLGLSGSGELVEHLERRLSRNAETLELGLRLSDRRLRSSNVVQSNFADTYYNRENAYLTIRNQLETIEDYQKAAPSKTR